MTPNKVNEVYWSHTLKQIRQYLTLKLSWWQTQAFQDYQNLVIIASKLFGKKEDSQNRDLPEPPKNKNEAIMQLTQVFAR